MLEGVLDIATLALGKLRSRHTRCANPALGLNQIRDGEVEAEGLITPQNHCDASTGFAERLRSETGRALGVRCAQERRGIRGLTCPFPSRRFSWQ